MYLTQMLRRAHQTRPNHRSTIDQGWLRTWFETADRVARLAGLLHARGFEAGDRVAILSLNSDRDFEALFAVPWAGGGGVPVNPRLTAPEIDLLLEDSGACTLCVDDCFAEMIGTL